MGIRSFWMKMTTWSHARARWAILLTVLAGCVILRLILVRFVILEPWRGILVDSEGYLELANNLVRDGTYGSLSQPDLDLFRTPGYPVFLASILALTGGSLRIVVIIQFLLVLVTAYLLYEIGKSIDRERVGILAAGMLLISPNSLFWSITLMTETLFSTGLILAFLLMVKSVSGKFPIWVVGLLLGLLTLIRPIGIFIILIWIIWFAVFNFKTLGGLGSLRKAAIFFLASMLVLGPWYIRNVEQHGMLTLSNVNRVTLYSYHLSLTLVEEEGISWDEAKAEIDALGGARSAAPKIILQFPLTFIRVQMRGIARTILGTESDTWFWLVSSSHTAESGDDYLEPLLRLNIPSVIEGLTKIKEEGRLASLVLNLWGLTFTFLILGLGLIGIVRGLKVGDWNLRAFILLALLTIVYLILSPGAAGEARFRIPAEPFLTLFAGMAFLKNRVSIGSSKSTGWG
jgi:4-amino-4-deoxy-L-arabinose transferase-like glycosyltransferase